MTFDPLPTPASLREALLAAEHELDLFDARLSSARYPAQSADGQLEVVANGIPLLVSARIDPRRADPAKLAELEAALVMLVGQALSAADAQSAADAALFARAPSLDGLCPLGDPLPNIAGFAEGIATWRALLPKIQASIEAAVFQAQVGSVIAVVNGRHDVIRITIRDLPDDIHLLEDDVVAAVNAALEGAQDRLDEDVVAKMPAVPGGGTVEFPSTGIRDSFNRQNGPLENNWYGEARLTGYAVVNRQLDIGSGGPIYWKAGAFGPSLEAYVTFVRVDADGGEQALLLKVQGEGNNPDYQKGAIKVVYDARARVVRVEAITSGQATWNGAGSFTATIHDGDQLGARALADGQVEVFQNGQRIGVAHTGSFFVNKRGRIGLWFRDASDAVLDDFGGGTALSH